MKAIWNHLCSNYKIVETSMKSCFPWFYCAICRDDMFKVFFKGLFFSKVQNLTWHPSGHQSHGSYGNRNLSLNRGCSNQRCYCWWFKNPAITSWDGNYPIIQGFKHPRWLARIHEPSTVVYQMGNSKFAGSVSRQPRSTTRSKQGQDRELIYSYDPAPDLVPNKGMGMGDTCRWSW